MGERVTGKGNRLFATANTEIVLTDEVANLVEIGETGWEVSEITTSELDSETVEAIPGELDYGSFDITGNLISEGNYAKLNALRGKMASFALYHPEVEEASFKCRGFLTSLKQGSRTKADLITFTATVRISGVPEDFVLPLA